MPAVGLAEVLATFGPAYLATHRLPRGAAKVWRAILACRTAALGGHLECLRSLRGDPPRLSLVPQPALPALPEPGQGSVGRRTAARSAAGAVLSPGVHAAARSQRLDRRGTAAALREPVCRGLGHADRVCRQSAPSGRGAGLLAGAAHVAAGSWPTRSSACAGRRWGAGRKRGVDRRRRRAFCFRYAHCRRCFAASSSPDSSVCALPADCLRA